MIDNLMGNKTNILVLRFLSKFDNQFFPIEEIVKGTGAGLRNTYDSLKVLLHEGILEIKSTSGKKYYRFVIDSIVKELMFKIFEEEKKRIFLRNIPTYKILSEVESRIVKIMGNNLIDIFLFGSVAKGRDTTNSDIDLCILVNRKDQKSIKKIRNIQFDNKYPNDIQFHVFTSREFLDASKEKNELVMNILKDGLSLRIGK